MPIGQFEDFAALKAHLRSQYRKASDKRLNAITAATAERIRPGWHREAAALAAKHRKEK